MKHSMGAFVTRAAEVAVFTGVALDRACYPRVFRKEHETDDSLRRRWYLSFDVSPTEVLVENEHLHRQVKELQEALTEKEMVVRELRRSLERLSR